MGQESYSFWSQAVNFGITQGHWGITPKGFELSGETWYRHLSRVNQMPIHFGVTDIKFEVNGVNFGVTGAELKKFNKFYSYQIEMWYTASP